MATARCRSFPILVGFVFGLLACGESGGRATDTSGSGGASGNGGASAAGAGGSTGSGGPGDRGTDAGDASRSIMSGLPVPPGGGVPAPSGAAANLTVLSWAGFKAAVSFTFDDSQPSQIAHYAELRATGVPMTFYIGSGNSSEANYDATWGAAAMNGDEIGNHTAHHCRADLTGCSFGAPLANLAAELDECTTYITRHYSQRDAWTGASPFGDTGYDTSAQSRFLLYRGVGNGTIGANDNTDPFNLPIHLAASAETAGSFDALTDSARASGRWIIFLIHTILPTNANWYNPVDIAGVTGSMAHAKSLDDTWSDTVVNIGAYWRAQKIFSSLRPTTSGTDTTWTWTLPPHFPPGKFLRLKVDGGTLRQGGQALVWDAHGYYEVALDPGSLTLSP